MTDCELLELAAKAGGVIGEYRSYYVEAYNKDFFGIAVNGVSSCGFWNPLTDDGDALRLAAKLRLDVCISKFNSFVTVWVSELVCVTEPYSSDPYTATRRAITRAAAEIGATL